MYSIKKFNSKESLYGGSTIYIGNFRMRGMALFIGGETRIDDE